jgi:NADPH:quinone reductase-like Zn-dependent oxidoreductase
MREIRLVKHGSPQESLLIKDDVQIPVPGKDEVLIRVNAASVNPIDFRISEKYGWTIFAEVKGVELPIVLGRDFAGEIVAIGTEVTAFSVSDRVWGAIDPFEIEGIKQGTHSQYIVLPVDKVVNTPISLSDIEASSLPYVFITTWNSICNVANIDLANIRGKKVLINGGSGGVGSMSIQLMKAYGAYVITTCSSKNTAFVKKLGADEVFEYDKGIFPDLTDVDFVYNLVPKEGSQKIAIETLRLSPLNKEDAETVYNAHKICIAELDKDISGFVLEQYKDILRHFDAAVAHITADKAVYLSIVSPMMKLTNQMGFHPGMREYVRSVLALKVEQLINYGRCYHYGFFTFNKLGMSELASLVESKQIVPNVSHCYSIDHVVDAFVQIGSGHTRGKVVLDMQNPV